MLSVVDCLFWMTELSSTIPSVAPVPEDVGDFLVFFQMHFQKRNLSQLKMIYEVSLPKLTEIYYKNSSWPPVSDITPLLQHDDLFLMLYREISFQHIFRRLSPPQYFPLSTPFKFSSSKSPEPSLQIYLESWENYMKIFENIIQSENTRDQLFLELPSVCLWDMVDQFVYQFQIYSLFRAHSKSPHYEEKQLIMWDFSEVIRILSQFVERIDLSPTSQIFKHENTEEDTLIPSQLFGIFSLISLAHVCVLIGDFYTALSIVEPLDSMESHFFQNYPSVYFTYCYIVGFVLYLYLLIR